MPAARSLPPLRTAAVAAALLVAACAPARGAGDSTTTAADSVAPAAQAPNAAPNAAPDAATDVTPDTTPRAAPADTGRPTTSRDSASRPRLTPRRPRPVPRPMPRPDGAPAGAAGDTADGERVALERLRTQAHALARADGCTAVAQCGVLPLGDRACGGPEEHLAYCARTTDVPALRRAADALARAERAYNAKHEVISTCEYRVAPVPQLVDGSCRAAARDGRTALPR